MKTLITRRSILIASVALLIAVTTIVSVNVFNSSGPITGIAGAVSRPLRTLASNIARVFESIYSSIYRYDNLMDDYEKVLRTLTERERNYREANDLRAENERFRVLLDFQELHTGYEHEQAMVEMRSMGNWSSSFTIDKGYTNSSIAQGNGVATEYGLLIGQVSKVGATNSTVITILDTKFSAGAFVGDGDGTATVKGDFSLMRSGLLMLDYIDDNLVVLPGDSVVTSGVGGVFPEGLVVGEVVEVFRHSTGIGRYATVKPMRDIDTMLYVFVITNFENANQEAPEQP
jgi:rod shape-determining protein MreC